MKPLPPSQLLVSIVEANGKGKTKTTSCESYAGIEHLALFGRMTLEKKGQAANCG